MEDATFWRDMDIDSQTKQRTEAGERQCQKTRQDKDSPRQDKT